MNAPEKSTFHTDQNRWEKHSEYFESIDNPENEEEIVDDDLHDDVSRFHVDQEIESAVKELLHHSHKLDARDLSVSVKEGVVTLSGSVHSQNERDYAQELARLVHGVTDVDTEIVVKLNEGILPTDIGRKSSGP